MIPDPQCKPGVPLDHLYWVAEAMVDYHADVYINIGDHYDMPSLSQHDGKGSKAQEGARYDKDIEAGRKGFDILGAPIGRAVKAASRNKRKKWQPEFHYALGNHENRTERAVEQDPKLDGPISIRHCASPGWRRHDFLERFWIDGLCYSHYFQGQNSSFPVGGTIDNRLNKIGESFVQGHQQGFMYGNRVYPTGRMRHGLVAGSCYLHREKYKGNQGNNHFRGVVVLNEVHDGDYCIMPLSLKYLCKRYEGIDLLTYMYKKYPKDNWEHLRT
jgi:hypothetical protein